jgi:DNA polymerase-3 subunit alpha
MSRFVHLHVHSDYSLLDGAASIDSLVDKAVACGMSHLALTDHGAMFGAVAFHDACRARGVTPLVGSECYLSRGSRHDRGAGHGSHEGERASRSFHMGLLARNETGYRNLMQLSTIGYTEGFYYRPRIDEEVLARHADGLIGFSGCLSAKIPWLIGEERIAEATDLAVTYRDMFGPGNFYLELQDHGLDKQQALNRALIEVAKRTEIPLVATNDVHYASRDDAHAQDVLICIGTGKRLSDADRLRFDSREFYFKEEAEMLRLFDGVPEAVHNTLQVAERCELEIPRPGPLMPDYEVPDGHTQESFLRHISERGLAERYDAVTPELRARLDYELGVIETMGYAGYFLIVWDFIAFARRRKLPVGPGRGSGAASLVAYVLRITDIEPFTYGLVFERFLNPERVSMPDFDIDFCYERRGEVISYVAEKYGSDRVAQIITFGTLKARAVIRDVARVLDIPYAEADAVAKLVPGGPKSNLKAAIEQEPGLHAVRERGGAYSDLLDISLKLEGLSRHASTHAAGIVIGREALTNYVPLYRDTRSGAISTQYTGEDILQGCGLVKMDFLGLKTLTVIENTVRLIRAGQAPDETPFDLAAIPEDDAKTYQMLGEGKATCVFQFESPGMRGLLTRARPQRIQDLMALTSLYRPGPMQFMDQFIEAKAGRRPVQYPLPELQTVLEETYGVIIYQEQVMKIAQIVAGYSLGQADILRRAMGKKKAAEMAQQRERFISGAAEKGYQKRVAADLFDMLAPFAEYGFAKPHAAAYSILSLQTAYLKAHHPAEFMAANLTNEMADTDKLADYISEARDMGLEVLPPDVNRSTGNFSVADGRIMFGLQGIKNVGSGAVAEIVAQREAAGPYTDLTEFLERVELGQVNRKVVETLVQVGAFDGLVEDQDRATLTANLERLLDQVAADKESRRYGQQSLFGEDNGELPRYALEVHEPWPQREVLRMEKEALGMFFSGHPLDEYREIAKRKAAVPLADLGSWAREGAKGERKVTVIGVVGEVREIQTRGGRQMAFAALEDLSGSAELVIFADPFSASRELLDSGTVVAATGSVDRSRGDPKMLVDTLTEPQQLPDRVARTLHLRLDSSVSDDRLLDLRERCMAERGDLELFIHCVGAEREWVIRANHILRVGGAPDVLARFRELPEVNEAWTE